MRLTTVILIASLMQVSAAGFAQRVTLNHKNTPLQQIFKEISRQTGYALFYDARILPKNHKIDIAVEDASVEDALNSAIKGLPLSFEINEKGVLIKKKEEPSFIDNVIARFQTIDVRGKVVDSLGNGLAGATVNLKNSRTSTSTAANGDFLLKNVEVGTILVISYLGYITREIPIVKDFNYIVLQQSASKLDEVQIQAYGTTSRRFSTGNISSVKAADIEKSPVNNPLLAIAGRVPGITITQANGYSNSGVGVLIQGQNSMIRGNDPFYVIDGVPYISQLLPNLGNTLGTSRSAGLSEAQNGNPLSFINPADIESIDILKDADATAIYGSRAANGAILITTKKGKSGTPRVNINVQSGIGQVARKIALLNTQQYLEMRKESYANAGVTNYPSNAYDINGSWSLTDYTDWQSQLIGGKARYNDYQGSIYGGNDNTQFVLGGGYHHETTVLPTSFGNRKGSVHLNISNSALKNKLRTTFSASYMIDNNELNQTDLTSYIFRLAPNGPQLRNPDGSINWANDVNGNSTYEFNQPIRLLEELYKNKTENLVTSALMSYRIFPNLELKSTFGFTNLTQNELATSPMSALPPSQRSSYTRSAKYGSSSIRSWIVEPQLTYTLTIGDGRLNMLAGMTFQRKESSRELIEGKGYNSDFVFENMKAATSITVPDGATIQSLYKYNAVFSQLNYNWKDRYIVNLSGRRDGSSRFGLNNRFMNFGAIGGAWIFSNENFLRNLWLLSFGKLKASYGITGSDQIGDYQYLQLFESNNPPISYRGSSSLIASNFANPDLQWESTKKLNVGIDIGFIKDRFLLGVNFFRNRSSNQLLTTALPLTTGMGSYATNLPATVQNTGWEFSLSASNITSSDINWTTGVNLTIPRNTLLNFRDIESSSFYASDYIVGRPVNLVRAWKFSGVNKQTGLYEYLNKNGEIVADPTVDYANRTEYIATDPLFFGGMTNSFTYKDFTLDFLVTFVKQKGQLDYFGTNVGYTIYNQPLRVLDRWKKEGDETKIQKYSSSLFNGYIANQSDAAYVDASYLRLKNVSVAWAIPTKWLEGLGGTKGSVYVQGQNLLTVTRYEGLDPETRSSLTLPPLRLFTVGVKATF